MMPDFFPGSGSPLEGEKAKAPRITYMRASVTFRYPKVGALGCRRRPCAVPVAELRKLIRPILLECFWSSKGNDESLR